MKTIKNIILVAIILIPGMVFSQGTETRKFENFTKLQIGGSFDTFIEYGNEASVRIEAEGIDPKKIITEVNGNSLKIDLEKGDYKNIRTKVYVTYKTLESIDRAGSGNLNCKSDLSAPDFKLGSSGSGNITISGKIKAQQHLAIMMSGSGDVHLASLEADDLNLSLAGSGSVHVSSGNIKTQSLRISGSGNINASGLKSDACSVSIAGSGNVQVNVTKSLEGKIAGSGNINYKGDAQITNVKISGSGRIRRS